MDLKEYLQSQQAKVNGLRMQHLEVLAAAYMLATDLPPTECELVEETKGGKLTWHFRRRTCSDAGSAT